MLKKILLVLFGLVMGFLITEASLGVFYQMKGKSAEGQFAVNETRNIHQYDSILGWNMAPGASARQKNSEFDVTYKINNEGFRDDKNYSLKPGDKRAIIFGDSFAFGIGVENEKTFSKILEKEIGREVLNFGVSGYDPGQYFLSLKNQGMKYNPDLIIYSIYLGNDIEDIILDHPFQGDRYKPYFGLKNGNLVLNGAPVPDKKYELRAIDYRVKNLQFYKKTGWLLKLKTVLLFKNLLKQNFYPLFEKFGLVKSIKDYDDNFAVLGGILEETKKTISDRKFIVLIVPSRNIKFNYLEKKFNEKLRLILVEKNIPFVDMTEEIVKKEDTYFLQEGHFNEQGHLITAKKIAELIKNK